MEDKEKEDQTNIDYPKYIYIKGYQLNYKSPPLKDNILRYRCRNGKFKYFKIIYHIQK